MSEHRVKTEWNRETESFGYNDYNRDHTLIFDDRNRVCASAAPEYNGNPDCVDPEQAFVASLSSCHMLTFLALASKKGYVVDRYVDEAFGVLGRNEARKPAITSVELHPVVSFAEGSAPDAEAFSNLHERAHSACFIANSIASCVKVGVNPRIA